MQFFNNQKGFNIVSTLVSVAIGGAVAVALATLITKSVSKQRQTFERDEMSEFALFIKNALTTDATCTALLSNQSYVKEDKRELELSLGYGDQPNATIKKGFIFGGDKLEIQELTLEDRSPATVDFRIGLADSSGKISETRVRRHLARVKLQVTNKSSGATYRPRYIEFPVLLNVDKNVIQMCNNEVNIGDACQALGFRWDTSKIPAECVPANSCLFGGSFTTKSNGTCLTPNPVTGTCSCQSNYKRVAMGSINLAQIACQKGCDSMSYDLVSQCYLCP